MSQWRKARIPTANLPLPQCELWRQGFLRELRLVSRVPPVLAVTTSCEAEQLPWHTLGSLEPM
jgi:hypothetical protein